MVLGQGMARQWVGREVCAVRCLCLRWAVVVLMVVAGMADLVCREGEAVMVRPEVDGIDYIPRQSDSTQG